MATAVSDFFRDLPPDNWDQAAFVGADNPPYRWESAPITYGEIAAARAGALLNQEAYKYFPTLHRTSGSSRISRMSPKGPARGYGQLTKSLLTPRSIVLKQKKKRNVARHNSPSIPHSSPHTPFPLHSIFPFFFNHLMIPPAENLFPPVRGQPLRGHGRQVLSSCCAAVLHKLGLFYVTKTPVRDCLCGCTAP